MHLSETEHEIIKIDEQRHNYPNLINDELEKKTDTETVTSDDCNNAAVI